MYVSEEALKYMFLSHHHRSELNRTGPNRTERCWSEPNLFKKNRKFRRDSVSQEH